MNYFNNSYVKLICKLLFTIVVLIIVFRSVPFQQVLIAVIHTRILWITSAAVFFILSKYFSSVRLNQFLEKSNTPVDAVYNLKLYLLGMFYNFFLPTGIGGDAYKIIKMNKDYCYPVKNLASTVLLDRISGLIALVNIAVLFSLYFLNFLSAMLLILFFLIGNMLYYFVIGKFIPTQFHSIKTELLSILVQLSQCICAYCMLRSLDVSTNELIYIIVFLISSIASLFPLSIGGLGAREYAFMIAATYFHLDKEKAIAIGFLFYIISLFVSLFGSYFIFKPISPVKTYV
jgi:uncharacterized membrane protein YbhN (UPF0104 family)